MRRIRVMSELDESFSAQTFMWRSDDIMIDNSAAQSRHNSAAPLPTRITSVIPNMTRWQHHAMASTDSIAPSLLVVLKPNRINHKHTDANCSNFHLRVFLWLSNPQGQRQTSTISIPRDNFGERKAKFGLETSGTTQMQLYT
jgi:hypothetical protein